MESGSMKYYIDGKDKIAILKVWSASNKEFRFRIIESVTGTISIERVVE